MLGALVDSLAAQRAFHDLRMIAQTLALEGFSWLCSAGFLILLWKPGGCFYKLVLGCGARLA